MYSAAGKHTEKPFEPGTHIQNIIKRRQDHSNEKMLLENFFIKTSSRSLPGWPKPRYTPRPKLF